MSLELPQSFARSGVMPLYAVVGEEDYLRDQSVAALRAAALGPAADTGFNYDIFHHLPPITPQLQQRSRHRRRRMLHLYP